MVILAHQRRRVVHVAVTAHPTASWTAQQLREACPGDAVPRYLIRDRDTAFARFGSTAMGMGIQEVLTAPRSPWQNGYVERLIGTMRRECLNHVLVMNAAGLCRILDSTSSTTTERGPIWRSIKTRRFTDRSHHLHSA